MAATKQLLGLALVACLLGCALAAPVAKPTKISRKLLHSSSHHESGSSGSTTPQIMTDSDQDASSDSDNSSDSTPSGPGNARILRAGGGHGGRSTGHGLPYQDRISNSAAMTEDDTMARIEAAVANAGKVLRRLQSQSGSSTTSSSSSNDADSDGSDSTPSGPGKARILGSQSRASGHGLPHQDRISHSAAMTEDEVSAHIAAAVTNGGKML